GAGPQPRLPRPRLLLRRGRPPRPAAPLLGRLAGGRPLPQRHHRAAVADDGARGPHDEEAGVRADLPHAGVLPLRPGDRAAGGLAAGRPPLPADRARRGGPAVERAAGPVAGPLARPVPGGRAALAALL